ncbi:MAG: secondary thiamine-phosphate synthase enzyme YjbQ [Simkania sp.]|nr:secondary thiamine-phosphate synthase enzyme YjbQ [Simkania sp.]MCB1082789.1 secondary thiamine-phosphate synthase enzyme YjbQ [Simkania sp.]MCP5490276.1 YjbQ family protein [Chlamydiales bacterium]
MHRETLIFPTRGREILSITEDVEEVVKSFKGKSGLCHLFLCHTSASLILCENTDPDVRLDLETFARSLIIDGDPKYRHDAEGPDDMPAHIRTVLTHSDLTLPFEDGALLLGTWQGVYLWEHRISGHHRKVIVSLFSQS